MDVEREVVSCARELVRIQSYSGQEAEVARYVVARMEALGFDEVLLDGMGNVLGRVGDGERVLLLDSHMDTVEVPDEEAWRIPPFEGRIQDGLLHGRGSADMKAALAASLHGAAMAKRRGWLEGRTVYVSATVMEEDCDGENLKHLLQETGIRPDAVVVCEPSNNRIVLGHKGKALVTVRTRGTSAHGATPERGRNAISEMADILQRVEALDRRLAATKGRRGTAVVTRIESMGASLNAVPSECEIHIDRRLGPGEDQALVEREMVALTEGKDASWEVAPVRRTSWTGMPVEYYPVHDSWSLAEDHPLTTACERAFWSVFSHESRPFGFWDFSTNAVTPVALGIPTIGFGPGDPAVAHARDEACPIQQIRDAALFYATLIREAP
ncbi:MAG: YgeY family selenium metabolism-linked hydrolase [Gemmatimonadota bacterium]